MVEVRQTLCRHVMLKKDSVQSEKEHFVIDQLHVPVEWLHEAKVCSFTCLFCTSFVFYMSYLKFTTVTCQTSYIININFNDV